MIKEAESSVCSIVGADGAIYALRKSLYEPLRSEQINDFILPSFGIGLIQSNTLKNKVKVKLCLELINTYFLYRVIYNLIGLSG